MRKTVLFRWAKFSAEVIDESLQLFVSACRAGTKHPEGVTPRYDSLLIRDGRVSWDYSTIDEFYAGLRTAHSTARLSITIQTPEPTYSSFLYEELPGFAEVTVALADRSSIERVMAPFENSAERFTLLPPEQPAPAPVVFIGHGRSGAWRDLKDHLAEKHGYQVQAYETGARAGHTIRDVLESMLMESSFAILVMTAEDEHADGSLHARQNVVHEAGLFQGKLGFSRAIVLLERGVTTFSNIDGVQYISFTTVAETFGEVLATLKREFPAL